MMENIRIIARDVFGDNQWTVWTQPLDLLIAHDTTEVSEVLKRVEKANNKGQFALGFVTYEAGAAFDASFCSVSGANTVPLAWFAVFDTHKPYTPDTQHAIQEAAWRSSKDRVAYKNHISEIKDRIAAGETYQVNYTFELTTETAIDSRAWFHTLYRRQPTPYAMLIETDAFHVVSISPELFFRRDGETVICEPMKGTLPRAPHPKLDHAQGKSLEQSKKNRAENIMIVDMVRNDLGRVAKDNSVRVEELFKTSPWPTLWQMTSKISAVTDAGLTGIFKELFPSASITGAPKIQTSRIITQLEDRPRGLYTGAIGWSLPDRQAQFAVAIRTAVQDRTTGVTTYGIGSGIVWDSEADSEYGECMLKAKLLDDDTPSFHLLETLRWDRISGYRFLEGHLKRLTESAQYFGFRVDRERVQQALDREALTFTAAHMRIRLLADTDETVTLASTELDAPAQYDAATAECMYTARIDALRNPIDSPFLYHKTTNRNLYEEARARNNDVDEVLLINEHEQAMEFSTGNLVIRRADEWLTPTLESGLLPGVFRDHLIDNEIIREAVVSIDEIKTADEIFFINSVRGWIRIKLV